MHKTRIFRIARKPNDLTDRSKNLREGVLCEYEENCEGNFRSKKSFQIGGEKTLVLWSFFLYILSFRPDGDFWRNFAQ